MTLPICSNYLTNYFSSLSLRGVCIEEVEQYIGDAEEHTSSTLYEYICLFRPSFLKRFPTDPSKPDPKLNEYLDLSNQRKEIIDSIRDHNETLKELKLAERLQDKLPEGAKHNNSHLKQLKEEYPTFFDEDSGNSSTKESLEEVKNYVMGEKASLKSELSQINSDIQKLHGANTEEDKNTSKRSASEVEGNSELSPNKISRTENNSYSEPDVSDSDLGGWDDFF